jgi:hypothetical protein
MTDVATLRALIERVEEGGGAGRETDAAITLAISPALGDEPFRYTGRGVWVDTSIPEGEFVTAKHYTSSLDAAASLVPDGWWIQYAAQNGHRGEWMFSLRSICRDMPYAESRLPTSAAHALTAAALRARLAEMEAGDD